MSDPSPELIEAMRAEVEDEGVPRRRVEGAARVATDALDQQAAEHERELLTQVSEILVDEQVAYELGQLAGRSEFTGQLEALRARYADLVAAAQWTVAAGYPVPLLRSALAALGEPTGKPT